MKRFHLQIFSAMTLLLFSASALAWVEHECGDDVGFADGFMLVAPNGSDDTAAVQCAGEAVIENDLLGLALEPGDFFIGALEFHGLEAEFRGASTNATTVTPLADVDCDSQFFGNMAPALWTFAGGGTNLGSLTVDATGVSGLCMDGGITDALVNFTGHAINGDCPRDVTRHRTDRLNVLDDPLNPSFFTALRFGPQIPTAECVPENLGTGSVNRNECDGALQCVEAGMIASAQFDVTFNTFNPALTAVALLDTKQTTSVVKNTINLTELPDGFGGVFRPFGVVAANFAGGPNQTRLAFEGNVCNTMGGYATGIGPICLIIFNALSDVPVDFRLTNRDNTFNLADDIGMQGEVYADGGGSLGGGSPTYNRTDEFCGPGDGSTQFPFEEESFVAEGDEVLIEHEQVSPLDGFICLHTNAFDPFNPGASCVACNDDNPFVGLSGFRAPVTHGDTYKLVTTTFSPAGEEGAEGDFFWTARQISGGTERYTSRAFEFQDVTNSVNAGNRGTGDGRLGLFFDAGGPGSSGGNSVTGNNGNGMSDEGPPNILFAPGTMGDTLGPNQGLTFEDNGTGTFASEDGNTKIEASGGSGQESSTGKDARTPLPQMFMDRSLNRSPKKDR